MRRRRFQNVEKQLNQPTQPSSPSFAHLSADSRSPDEAYRPSNDGFLAHSGGLMKSSSKTSGKQFDDVSAPDQPCRRGYEEQLSFDTRNLRLMHNSVPVETQRNSNLNFKKDFSSTDTRVDPKGQPFNMRGTLREQTDSAEKGDSYLLHLDSSCVSGAASFCESSRVSSIEPKARTFEKGINCNESSQENMNTNDGSEGSGFHFDICPNSTGSFIRLKVPLHLKNREKRNEINRKMEGPCVIVLRPGMFLLKHYISFNDQVKLIKKCKELGLGPGGFYVPGYRDGAKLNLKMMCLGKHWDPDTSTYSNERPSDGAKPPLVPAEFHDLVKRAIKDSHVYLEKHYKKRNVEDILPSMSPNICIANFYTRSGRLGLHQDKDESQESLHRGLPVVSFSVGDTAEFLYGDQRDIDKVEKIRLESGDVLIFGGKARHIYHGVSTIFPDTAPKPLLEETNLRPGRLNLTFREY